MTPSPAIVFDLDGTLIDSAPDIHACVNAALQDGGWPVLSLDQVRSFIGGGVDVLWQKIAVALQIGPDALPDLMAAFMARYHDATALTRIFPGALEALRILQTRGHPLGLCTNKPLVPTMAILNHFQIRDLFSCIIGGDSLPQKKPDPAPLRAAFAGLSGAATGLYVGDSEFDALTAAAMGVPFFIYTEGYRLTPLDQMIYHTSFSDFATLPDLVSAHAVA